VWPGWSANVGLSGWCKPRVPEGSVIVSAAGGIFHRVDVPRTPESPLISFCNIRLGGSDIGNLPVILQGKNTCFPQRLPHLLKTCRTLER
jgi:hypothetical protein